MKSLKTVVAMATLATLAACDGGGSGSDNNMAAADGTGDTTPAVSQPPVTPTDEKVTFSKLARDMIAVPESDEAWDVSEFDIEMDIDENADPSQFDDLWDTES